MKHLLILCLSLVFVASCADGFLDRKPTASSPEDALFSTAQGVGSALAGCYSDLQDYSYYGRNFVLIPEVYADNAKLSSQNTGNFAAFYNFSVTADDADLKAFWATAYRIVKNADKIVKACEDPRLGIPATVLGEALAVRSLAYFDLLRMFGGFAHKNSEDKSGIPIADDTIPLPSRTALPKVYSKITADLQQAEQLLEGTPAEPFRFNQASVQALLAIVYMFNDQWTKAIEYGEKVIASGNYSLLTAEEYLASWSQAASGESIFSVAMSATDNPGTNSIGHMLSPDGYGGLVPTEDLLGLYSDTDIRTAFVTKRAEKFFIKYPGREGLGTDNVPVIRLSEIYFILAECYLIKAAVPNPDPSYIEKAEEIISKLASRADPAFSLDSYSPNEWHSVLQNEFRKEFAFEGKRFFQQKRSVTEDPIERTDCNSATCRVENPSNLFAFPIPLAETNANHNVTQNKGY